MVVVGPKLFHADDRRFPVVADAELLGQKLTAVAYRGLPRDLYDMHQMLGMGWEQRPRARACYLAYSFLSDHEWYRLDYPVKLDVDFRPEQLNDVLRHGEEAPTLAAVRERAKLALVSPDPPFTAATTEEQALRKRLLEGDRSAFADIADEVDAPRRQALAEHPGLRWRLQQAARTGQSG